MDVAGKISILNDAARFEHFTQEIILTISFTVNEENKIQCITRFVTPRFVNETRFVNTFFGNENVTNRVLGGFQKAKCQIKYTIW